MRDGSGAFDGLVVPDEWFGDETVAEIARRVLASNVTILRERFRAPGWTYEGQSRSKCPLCGFGMVEARKPYVASSLGKRRVQRYTAFICGNCGVTFDKQEIDQLRSAVTAPVSDASKHEKGAGPVQRSGHIDAVADRSPAESLDEEGVVALLSILPYRQKRVLELRQEGQTLAETGAVFSVTRERARQIQVQALRRLAAQAGSTVDVVTEILGLSSPDPNTLAVDRVKRGVFPESNRPGSPLSEAEVAAFDETLRSAITGGMVAGRWLAACVLGGSDSQRVRQFGYDLLPAFGTFPSVMRVEMVDRIDRLLELRELALAGAFRPVLCLSGGHPRAAEHQADSDASRQRKPMCHPPSADTD